MKAYPAYKASGIEWLGEIPAHWEIKSLKYAVEINQNTLPENTDKEYQIQYIDIGNVSQDGFLSPPKTMTFGESPSRARRITKQYDTIISTVRTYLKAIAYIDSNAKNLIASTGFAVLTPTNQMYPKYLYYSVSSPQFINTVSASSVGVSYPAINSSDLRGIPIWFPKSLAEQRAIAAYLDRKTRLIDTYLTKKQQQLERWQAYRAALINQAVTKGINPAAPMKDSGIEWLGEIPAHWEVKKLKHLSTIVLGKMLTPEDKGGYYNRPYLRAKNVLWEKVDVSDVKEMWFSEQELNKYRLNLYDILISEGGEVGRTGIWRNEIEECYIQNSVHKVTIHRDCNPFYFLYLFLVYGKLGHFDAIVEKVSIGHLTKEKLTEVFCLAPSFKEQRTIVAYLDEQTAKIDHLIAVTQRQIDRLHAYRTALISAAVTGKLDVRNDWDDTEETEQKKFQDSLTP